MSSKQTVEEYRRNLENYIIKGKKHLKKIEKQTEDAKIFKGAKLKAHREPKKK